MAPEPAWERSTESLESIQLESGRAHAASGVAETRGLQAGTQTTGRASVRAVGARFVGDEHLIVNLDDGRQIIASLIWFPRLVFATAAEREAWELVDEGRGILWRTVGQRLLVAQLLGLADETLDDDGATAGERLSAAMTALVAAPESGTLGAAAPSMPAHVRRDTEVEPAHG